MRGGERDNGSEWEGLTGNKYDVRLEIYRKRVRERGVPGIRDERGLSRRERQIEITCDSETER